MSYAVKGAGEEANTSEMDLPPGWAFHSVSVLYPDKVSAPASTPQTPMLRRHSEGRIVLQHTGSSKRSKDAVAAAPETGPEIPVLAANERDRELSDLDMFVAQFALASGHSPASRSDRHVAAGQSPRNALEHSRRGPEPPELPTHKHAYQSTTLPRNTIVGRAAPSRAAAASADRPALSGTSLGCSGITQPVESPCSVRASSASTQRGSRSNRDRSPRRRAGDHQQPAALTPPSRSRNMHSHVAVSSGHSLDLLSSRIGDTAPRIFPGIASSPVSHNQAGFHTSEESPPPRHPGPARAAIHTSERLGSGRSARHAIDGTPASDVHLHEHTPTPASDVHLHEHTPTPVSDVHLHSPQEDRVRGESMRAATSLSQSPPSTRDVSPATATLTGGGKPKKSKHRHRLGRRPSRIDLPPPASPSKDQLDALLVHQSGEDLTDTRRHPSKARSTAWKHADTVHGSAISVVPHEIEMDCDTTEGAKCHNGHAGSPSTQVYRRDRNAGSSAGSPHEASASRRIIEAGHHDSAGSSETSGIRVAVGAGGILNTPESRLLVPWEHDAASNSTSRSGSRLRHSRFETPRQGAQPTFDGIAAATQPPAGRELPTHAPSRREELGGDDDDDVDGAGVTAPDDDSASSVGSSSRLAEPRVGVMRGLERLRSTTALTSAHQAHPRGLADDDIFARTFTELAGHGGSQRRASVTSIASTEHTVESHNLAVKA